MINVKELRIGNYLFVPGVAVIVKVKAIFSTHFRCENPYSIDFGESVRINYQPIPLTPEWLAKFGFKNNPDKSLCYTGPFMLCNYNEDNIYYFDYGFGKTEILYVHHLQNLYFVLTGKELIS